MDTSVSKLVEQANIGLEALAVLVKDHGGSVEAVRSGASPRSIDYMVRSRRVRAKESASSSVFAKIACADAVLKNGRLLVGGHNFNANSLATKHLPALLNGAKTASAGPGVLTASPSGVVFNGTTVDWGTVKNLRDALVAALGVK